MQFIGQIAGAPSSSSSSAAPTTNERPSGSVSVFLSVEKQKKPCRAGSVNPQSGSFPIKAYTMAACCASQQSRTASKTTSRTSRRRMSRDIMTAVRRLAARSALVRCPVPGTNPQSHRRRLKPPVFFFLVGPAPITDPATQHTGLSLAGAPLSAKEGHPAQRGTGPHIRANALPWTRAAQHHGHSTTGTAFSGHPRGMCSSEAARGRARRYSQRRRHHRANKAFSGR